MDILASRFGLTNFKFDEGDLADLFEIDYHNDQLDIYKIERVIKDEQFVM